MNLRKYRTEKELTQTELARQMNVSRQAIYEWENGKKNPTMDKLKKLSKILGVSIDKLVMEE